MNYFPTWTAFIARNTVNSARAELGAVSGTWLGVDTFALAAQYPYIQLERQGDDFYFRLSLTDKARALVDLADTETRELDKDEARSWEDMMGQVDQLTTRIEREEKLRNAETETTRSHREPTRPDVGPEENRQAQGQPQRFRSFGEQMQAVMRAAQPGGHVDPRLTTRAVTGMSEGMPSDGGFLVQTDFATELLKRTYETGQVANRCRRIPICGNANGLKIPAIDEICRADGSRWGGVRAYWTAEAGDKTNATPAFRQMELSLKKLTGLAYADRRTAGRRERAGRRADAGVL